MNEEPLIWTSKGNLPMSSLKYTTSWQITEEYVKFVEKYMLGDELVKENAHVLSLQGFGCSAQLQPLVG